MSDDSVAVPLILSLVSQEVARGGAAAEDVVPPGHPQPFPRALQSGQLPCPQSRLPASRRTLQRDLRKSHKHTAGIFQKKKQKRVDFSGIQRAAKHLISSPSRPLVGLIFSPSIIIWCGRSAPKNTASVRHGRARQMFIFGPSRKTRRGRF